MSLDLFVTTLFHHCLPYFSLFHDPNALRTEVLLQPWKGFSSLCAALCDSVKSSTRPLGAPVSLVWELLDLVVVNSVALPLDGVLLSQPQAQ